LGCNDGGAERPPNLPPGWSYQNADEFLPGGDPLSTGGVPDPNLGRVPNMWVHRGYLYRQPTAGESIEMTLDVEIYTNTFFGGEYETFTGGTINQTDPVYCQSVVSTAESGSLSVQFCNTNMVSGGSYVGVTNCYMPQSVDYYEQRDDLTITMHTNPLPFPLKAGECHWYSWDFDVEGPVNVTEVYCQTYLYAGNVAGIGTPLAEAEYSCSVQIPSFQDLGKHETIVEFNEYKCKKYDLFCQLSEENPFERDFIYFFIFFIVFLAALFTFQVLHYVGITKKTNKMTSDIAEKNIKKRKVAEDQALQKQKEAFQQVLDSNKPRQGGGYAEPVSQARRRNVHKEKEEETASEVEIDFAFQDEYDLAPYGNNAGGVLRERSFRDLEDFGDYGRK
jgi:hypothetical protein